MREDIRTRLAELRLSLTLLTRLPVGPIEEPLPPMSRAVWALPLAGAIAAIGPAVVFVLAFAVLPGQMAALLAIGAGMLVTGGFHEDGLADTADSAGGWTRARKLEIMRDSRIGTYGALALIIVTGLRVAALAGAPGGWQGAAALIVIGAASRAPVPLIMAFLPPARQDGVSAEVAEVEPPAWMAALVIGGAALLTLPLPGVSAIALMVAGVSVSLLSRRWLGGRTGDTLGATQQMGEVALWLVLAAGWHG